MGKIQKKHPIFTAIKVLMVIPALIILAIVIHLITHSGRKANPTPPPVTSHNDISPAATPAAYPYATLSPATVPSKTAECNQPITFAGNGNSGPVTCGNGDLNATEWNALAALEPTVMSLGYGPTASQVQTALCNDANASNSDANTKNSLIVEATVYQITALYY